MASSSPSASSSTATALKTFDLHNDIETVDSDKIFRYDSEEQKRINDEKPWKKDPNYFRAVKISAIALIKMVMHARSGGSYEIMGLMQGKIDGDTFVVMDAFALPVQGTETRVNAGSEANEYMAQYNETSKEVGRPENIVGWYHSHPGYRCWLSGIDVTTQMNNQQFQDPFLAIVIDPNHTVSAGKVDIGAFRTYPEGYTPPDAEPSQFQSVPLEKIEDFGVHASRYYPLQVTHFKSSLDAQILDLLWNKYWAMTLSQSPLISNRAFQTSRLSDLTNKLENASTSVRQSSQLGNIVPADIYATLKSRDKSAKANIEKREESSFSKLVQESEELRHENAHGLMAQVLKKHVFDTRGQDNEPVELPEIL